MLHVVKPIHQLARITQKGFWIQEIFAQYTQIYQLTKHLATEDDAHHPVYD